MAKKEIKLELPSVDDLFTTQEERDQKTAEQILEIPVKEISDFPNHPFKVRLDKEMQDMIESINQYGILVPAIVREKEGGSIEMISGHRRKFAAIEAGLSVIPCIKKSLTDDEAIIIMVDANIQRENILPSEKAFAFKLKLEAMKRQGKRTDLTSSPLETKLKSSRSDVELGRQVGESKEQIHRYIRLTNLTPDILDLVDEGRIAFRPAVEVSYLTEQEQSILYDNIVLEEKTPSLSQAVKMKNLSKKGELDDEGIFKIMIEEKGNQKEQFKMPKEKIGRYFPEGTTKEVMQDTIIKALEYYQKRTKEKTR
ncbi:ParB-like chromosome segregation protein Spo0J [Aequitasia blattaphilus]|uniref:ParB/RepB/Spo0J family partition protein n=2 Tax=Lachnospiraceae TaxID=186803 RepID=A0ABT1EFV5_9FIRM|nr:MULTISPECIES: ParB/RepB/Spo0J family partition protein [Lachnospiraceae]MCP1100989.1 ParB/RepB/Spo0J family partition protein [Aequitasia blattaphilus]MCP1109582.1 ParB/RepB/Spo0J family partition protein [Ohessyouella blattaphilus]MCR8562976.1 ParB/RepB/Spo0J family partition protein [Ohessyouella blattaphilus]MCR8613629.1 ParB/RepB/Spo0J family partition protein [Aequitasia blattaphilus]